MFWAGLLPQPRPKGDISIELSWGHSHGVPTGNGFTLAAWINPSDVSQRHPLFEWNVGDGTTYWGVHFQIDPISFHAGPGALYANIVDNNGRWHQIHSAAGLSHLIFFNMWR